MSRARKLLEVGLSVIQNLMGKLTDSDIDSEVKEKLALAVLDDPSATEEQKKYASEWLANYKKG